MHLCEGKTLMRFCGFIPEKAYGIDSGGVGGMVTVRLCLLLGTPHRDRTLNKNGKSERKKKVRLKRIRLWRED